MSASTAGWIATAAAVLAVIALVAWGWTLVLLARARAAQRVLLGGRKQDLVLSESSDNKVVATTELAFEVAVQDTGDSLESNIQVTLTIQKQGAPIKQTQTIDVINPGETKKVLFKNIDTTGVFGVRTTLKVDVQPVPSEARIENNSKQYPVIFSLSP